MSTVYFIDKTNLHPYVLQLHKTILLEIKNLHSHIMLALTNNLTLSEIEIIYILLTLIYQ